MAIAERLYRISFVAQRLGISRRSVYNRIAKGTVEVVKLSKRSWRIPETFLRKWLGEYFEPLFR